MPLVHQATSIHNINTPPESAARGVGKPRRWSKPAEPTILTLAHTHIRTHYLHLRTFTCAQPHSLTFSCIQFQPFVVWPGCHVTTAISLAVLSRLTESCSHASAYIITRHSAISQLKGVGCTGMGFILIHVDVDDEYSKSFFFIFVVSSCYTTGGPIFRLRSASPANVPL